MLLASHNISSRAPTISNAGHKQIKASHPRLQSLRRLERSPKTCALAKERVVSLIDAGFDNYSEGTELGSAMQDLLTKSTYTVPTEKTLPGPRLQGTWKVFHAPHIRSMSSVLATRFDPIIYRLGPGGAFISNVRYSNPLLGSGWLSAAGSLKGRKDTSVDVDFKRFYMDFRDELLRKDIINHEDNAEGGASESLEGNAADRVMTWLGRLLFIPQFAVFPVHYLDDDIVTFEFSPLRSKISARRVSNEF